MSKGRCIYEAKVILTDTETHSSDWKGEGPADKVLMEALTFLKTKDSSSIMHRIINYMVEDWRSFDTKMTELLLKKKDK